MKSGIYTITNIVNGKMYVGYTKSFGDREDSHFYKLRAGNHANRHLQGAFNIYGEGNFIFEPLEECPQNMLEAMEHYWCNMLNTHDDRYGYNLNPTHPDGIAGPSLIQKEKIRDTLRKTSKFRKAIVQLYLDGTFIREFDSIGDCERTTGIKSRSICEVAKGIHKSVGNSIFVYKDKYDVGKDYSRGNSIIDCRKPVLQFSLDGEPIKRWESVADASEFLFGKRDFSGISNCCSGVLKSSAGFIWIYEEEFPIKDLFVVGEQKQAETLV